MSALAVCGCLLSSRLVSFLCAETEQDSNRRRSESAANFSESLFHQLEVSDVAVLSDR